MSTKPRPNKHPFTTSIDQALAARMANCQDSACTTLEIPNGPQLPVYVCTLHKARPQACRLSHGPCHLEAHWQGPERIEVA